MTRAELGIKCTGSAEGNEPKARDVSSDSSLSTPQWCHALEQVAEMSLTQLMEHIRPHVRAIVRTWPGADCDETLQDVMIELAKYDTIKRFDPERGAFWSFARILIYRASLRSIEKQLDLRAKSRKRSKRKEF